MKKKILFIADGLLQTQLGIGKVSDNNLKCLYKIFGEENVDVLVIENKRYENKAKYEVIVPDRSKLEKYKNLLCGYYNFSKKLENQVIEKIKKEKYDEVFIDNSWYGKLVERIKKEFKEVKITIFFHDIKKYLVKIWLKEKGFNFLKFYYAIIYNEKKTVEFADRFVVLNERENQNLNKYYGKTAKEIIPISLEDAYIPLKIEETNEKNLLFVGANYGPNYNGIKWFIKNVMQKLQDSKIKLTIVGNGTEKWREEFENNQISVKGRVEDLGEFYQQADIVILPIFEGAGMKVKTAEALMYGKYIIASEEALEGYSINESIGIEANTAIEYLEAIKNTLEKIKKNSIEKYNEECRKLYKEKYSFESSVVKYRKVFDI